MALDLSYQMCCYRFGMLLFKSPICLVTVFYTKYVHTKKSQISDVARYRKEKLLIFV
jgi:hypothetical protein